MIRLMKRGAPWLLLLGLLASCSTPPPAESGPSYKELKSMVVDILKTEEGQKAIEEAEKMKAAGAESTTIQMLHSSEGQQIQLAVKNVLTDPAYHKMLEKLMLDPRFAGEFAKAVQKENKQIHKDLMKDPEYQKLLLATMKDPEFNKLITDILKGKEYRQFTMTIMADALKNPLFKVELMDLMKKAIEEETKSKDSAAAKSEEGGSESGG